MTISNSFRVSIVDASSAPSWFLGLTENTWTVPSGTNRIQDVVPDPPYPRNYTTDDITGAGNGAAVDQGNREMWIVGTGGHSGWWGSEGYRLVLTENAAPRWERAVDWLPSYRDDVQYLLDSATPQANQDYTMQQLVDYGAGASGTVTWLGPDGSSWDRYMWPTTMVDGVSVGQRVRQWVPWDTPDVDSILERPRPGHTCYAIHYSNGKVWYPMTTASNNGSGRGSRVPHSFDCNYVRNYMAANGVPYPHGYGNKLPWKYYPAVNSQIPPTTPGASALDSFTGTMWYQGPNITKFFRVETLPGIEGQSQVYTLPFGANNRFANAPSAICPYPNRRMWVVIPTLGNATTPQDEIVVYDLDAIEAGTVVAERVVVPGLDTLPWARLRTIVEARKGYGMLWHEPSKAFLMFNCDESPRTATQTTIFKLTPPLNADLSWNRQGQWAVSQVVVSGVPGVCSTGVTGISGSSFSRFNIINDMGNGDALLISVGNVLDPPYFMRLSGAL